jgi:hypothetical protein
MEILGSSPARVTHLNRGLGDLSLAWRDRGWRRLEFGPGEASKGLTQIKQGIWRITRNRMLAFRAGVRSNVARSAAIPCFSV